MAAIFYEDKGEAMFRPGVAVQSFIKVQFLDKLLGDDRKKAMLVLSSVEIQSNEVVQVFMTFDDVVKYFYFGKGVGQLNITGTIYSTFDKDCKEEMSGTDMLYEAVDAVRGTLVKVSLGKVTFSGVISNFRTSTSAEPTLATEFSITILVTDQSKFGPLTVKPSIAC